MIGSACRHTIFHPSSSRLTTSELDEAAYPHPEPHADAMAGRALTRSLAALGPRQRLAIVLRYYGERSTREIAWSKMAPLHNAYRNAIHEQDKSIAASLRRFACSSAASRRFMNVARFGSCVSRSRRTYRMSDAELH